MPDTPSVATRRGWLLRLTGIAGPPMLLAVAGLLHPAVLTPTTAHHWRNLHLLLMPVFPLLGLGPWLLAAGRPVLRTATAFLGYVYAVFYSALDVLAGIGTGTLVENGQSTAARGLFAVGNQLSYVGVGAYLAAVLLVSLHLLLRHHAAALVGTVLMVGSAGSFLTSHIYWPRGVLTMIGLAVGGALLTVVQARTGPSASRSQASSRSMPS